MNYNLHIYVVSSHDNANVYNNKNEFFRVNVVSFKWQQFFQSYPIQKSQNVILKCCGYTKEQIVGANVWKSAEGEKLLVRNCVIFKFLTHPHLLVPLCQHERCPVWQEAKHFWNEKQHTSTNLFCLTLKYIRATLVMVPVVAKNWKKATIAYWWMYECRGNHSTRQFLTVKFDCEYLPDMFPHFHLATITRFKRG